MGMVTYQFEVDDELWTAWKRTVPRDTPLDERLRELLRADRDGRVQPARDATPGQGQHERRVDATADPLVDVSFPQGRDREACEEAVYAARDYLRTHGPASMREIVTAVMPQHDLGYDVPDLEPGQRYRGSWWRKVVKPGLENLPGVEKPQRGGNKWSVRHDS